MTRLLPLLALVLFACGGDSGEDTAETDATTTPSTPTTGSGVVPSTARASDHLEPTSGPESTAEA